MANEDWEARKQILELQKHVSVLQAMTLLAVAEMRALREMSISVWEVNQVLRAESHTISHSLDKMADEHLNALLASFADKNM